MKKVLIVFLSLLLHQTYAQNSKFGLSIQGGRVMPSSDFGTFSQNGIAGEIDFNRAVGPKLSVVLGADFESMSAINSDEKWQKLGLNIGPSYHLLQSKYKLDVFGLIGYVRRSIPNIKTAYPNSDVLISKLNGQSSGGLQAVIGIKVGYAISKRINLFVKPQYTTSFSRVSYQSRDLSPAVNERGGLDIEAANNIQFQNRTVNPAGGSVNVGIDILFANDWNSTRSNKTSKTS